MNKDIGNKIKELRNSKNLTLKDLSNRTNLSTGFLSQLERGMTTVAIDILENIAKALEVDIFHLLVLPKNNKGHILRHYEQTVFQVESDKYIQYNLTNNIESKQMLPRIIELLPSATTESITEYQHNGEEFLYVLEGILTIFIEHQRYELYPGDSVYINSHLNHNLGNFTNKSVRVLLVNTPNPFKTHDKNK